MIVEQRTYTFQPGRLKDYLALYREFGLALHLRHYERLVGWFTSESGTLNQVIQQWAFDSHEDRARRRDAIQADPQWLAFLAKVAGMVVTQESRILNPTPWSPNHARP